MDQRDQFSDWNRIHNRAVRIIDGQKMSKSYNNTIPLWLPAKELRKAILGIVTNSLAPGEAKNPDDSNIFSIYQAFASADETAAKQVYERGLKEGVPLPEL